MDDTPETGSDDMSADDDMDAVTLLVADHDDVRHGFETYEDLVDREAGDDEKQELADRICILLTLHAELEEEIFYPAARQALEEQELLDEAQAEHARAKELIAEIEQMEAGEEDFDAKISQLAEMVEHHVAEEEGQLFPALADGAALDMHALGAQLMRRKRELMADVGLEQDA